MKKVFAVLCGCMMIMLAACEGNQNTADNVTPAATVKSEAKQPVTPAAEPEANGTGENGNDVNASNVAAPTTPASTDLEPIREIDPIDAKTFIERFTSIGKERSVSRMNEIKAQFDGNTIFEDRSVYVVYLDLETLPKDGIKKSDDEEDSCWYQWIGDEDEYAMLRGISFLDEEYQSGILEIEIREAAAYGVTPGENGLDRSCYWLYFRDSSADSVREVTIYEEGFDTVSNPMIGVTDSVRMYYQTAADRICDLVFEMEHSELNPEEAGTYKLIRHLAVLDTIREVEEDYYIDTIVKQCDNAEGVGTTGT